jgi:hypothetical protein
MLTFTKIGFENGPQEWAINLFFLFYNYFKFRLWVFYKTFRQIEVVFKTVTSFYTYQIINAKFLTQ